MPVSTPAVPPNASDEIRTALRHGLDPAAWATDVLGFRADPWQERVLRSNASQILIGCSRQLGKSTIAAVKSLHAASYKNDCLVLMIALTQRQSTELLAKASTFLRRLPGAKLDNESTVSIKFANGNRLVSLPGTDPDCIRGFSAPSVVVIDEAAFVDDKLYYAIRPMLAVGGG